VLIAAAAGEAALVKGLNPLIARGLVTDAFQMVAGEEAMLAFCAASVPLA